MSKFKISYNDIPRRAASTSLTTGSENANHPHENLFYGTSGIYFVSNASVTETAITLDLGSGVTATVDHMIIRGINLFLQNSVGTRRIRLRGSTDNFSASNVVVLDSGDFTTNAAFLGSQSDDLVITGTESSAYRYWRVQITTSSACLHYLRKVYFGKFFDFGDRTPSYPYIPGLEVPNQGFESDAGTIFSTSNGYAKRSLSLNYKGITDDIRDEFRTKIGQYLADFPVFLYSESDLGHDVLDSSRVLFGWLTANYSAEQWKDNNKIGLTFREDLFG